MTTEARYRASASKPCPVCGSGSKGCSVNVDDSVFCRGDAGPEWHRVKAGETFHTYRRKDDRHDARGPHSRSGTNGKAGKPKDWPTEAAKYAKALTPERAAALAENLGLPLESIGLIDGIGYATHAEKDDEENWVEAWTMPERDGDKIIGIGKRFTKRVMIQGAEAGKGFFKGGSRGLTIPVGWKDRAGPIILPEGASDVVALSHCGLPCIGRPNNESGADLLSKLLKDIDCDIIVGAENDAKPDGTWPGRDGAIKIAKALADALGRLVGWAAPPEGIKDARAWVRDIAAGWGDVEDWYGAGQEILHHLTANAKFFKPGETPPGTGSRWPLPKYISELSTETEPLDWFWTCCVARRHTTLFSALMKCGKTTFLSLLYQSFKNGSTFAGRDTCICRTLVVTEESETLWAMRRDALGLDDHLSILSKPMMARPNQADWVEFVTFVHDQAVARKCDIVVFDSISAFAPWKSENDSAEVQATMTPLNKLTAAGLAVLLVHHIGKADGILELRDTGDPGESRGHPKRGAVYRLKRALKALLREEGFVCTRIAPAQPAPNNGHEEVTK